MPNPESSKKNGAKARGAKRGSSHAKLSPDLNLTKQIRVDPKVWEDFKKLVGKNEAVILIHEFMTNYCKKETELN